MRIPRWSRWLVSRVAPHGRKDELLGDLEEAYRRNLAQSGVVGARAANTRDTVTLVSAVLREQGRRGGVWSESSGSGGSVSALDVKLGLRMLMKHPALSIVSVIGMSVGIAIGAGGFEALSSFTSTEMPLSDDEEIVALQIDHALYPGAQEHQIMNDFTQWREGVKSVTELSAFTDEQRTLVTPARAVHLVNVTRMTASGFGVARVQPMLGRTLQPEDERPNAPPVAVIGYDAWQQYFHGDRAILGGQMQLGSVFYTVVGIMPAGYRWPLNHNFWIPLVTAAPPPTSEGPAIHVFGRLADGVSMEQARAEMATIGRQMASASPKTHEHLRPTVLPYTHPFGAIDSPGDVWSMRIIQIALSLLLIIVAVNVSVLIYARTAARAPEILVRTALGASRARVVVMLFIEALLLSGLSAVLGLTLAATGLRMVQQFQSMETDVTHPFWFNYNLSLPTIAYAAGLTIVAAIIIGVLPALKMTGRRMHDSLKQLSVRGGQLQLGRTWTTLIIVQVAIAVAALPMAIILSRDTIESGLVEPGYAHGELLHSRISLTRPGDFPERGYELLRRIESDPAFAAVTYAKYLPGEGQFLDIEVQGVKELKNAQLAEVEPGYFKDMGVQIQQGRDFVASDTMGAREAIIVDRLFAATVLGGANPIGQQIRAVWPSKENPDELVRGEWQTIVGVVGPISGELGSLNPDPWMFVPMDFVLKSGQLALSARVAPGNDPGSAINRLRQITAEVDPDFMLGELRTATERETQQARAMFAVGLVITVATLAVLLLSSAGIYAMMSFTVVRRRREIGIRMALGASKWSVLRGIFARSAAQLSVGAIVGLSLALALEKATAQGPMFGGSFAILPIVVATFMLVGLLSAFGPARRGLAVEPTETLRQE